jgi:hypothetical protein
MTEVVEVNPGKERTKMRTLVARLLLALFILSMGAPVRSQAPPPPPTPPHPCTPGPGSGCGVGGGH